MDILIIRSILAQLEYQHQVCSWDEKGVPFRTCMYVPDIHPIRKEVFHEKEDFAHVLKVRIRILFKRMCMTQFW